MKQHYISEFCPPLRLRITCTKEYWDHINKKHSEIKGEDELVRRSIRHPLEIRESKKAKSVNLIYNLGEKRYICIVVKILRARGFIVTCYLTDKIKGGKVVWQKVES